MCGRFDFHTPVNVIARRYFDRQEAGVDGGGPKFNVPPGTPITVIHATADQSAQFGRLMWGYHPLNSSDDAPTPINARAETVARSPFFREAFARKRCLVPANGWFEWRKGEQGKQPYYVTCPAHTEEDVLFFAAIMDDRPAPGVAILTEPAAQHLTHIHPRQPVVLDPICRHDWLDAGLTDRSQIRQAAKRLDVEQFQAWPVSTAVNKTANDYAALIEPETAARYEP